MQTKNLAAKVLKKCKEGNLNKIDVFL